VSAAFVALAPFAAAADELPPPEVARPPLPEVKGPAAPSWRTHLEVGAQFTLTSRPMIGGTSSVRFPTSPGMGMFLGWELFRYLRASFGASYVFQSLAAPLDAVVPGMQASSLPAHGYTLSVHVSPMLKLSRRVRAFASVGLAWTRIELGRVTADGPTGAAEVRERVLSFYEVPVGFGSMVDLVEGWVALHGEVTFGPAFGVDGNAHETGQVIDATGAKRPVLPLDGPVGSATQRLGISVRF
jgi:hypothetical protein